MGGLFAPAAFARAVVADASRPEAAFVGRSSDADGPAHPPERDEDRRLGLLSAPAPVGEKPIEE